MNEFVNENIERGSSILDRFEEAIFPGEVDIDGTGYERNILDGRIEKYLDRHLDEYIEEFGLIRELHLEIYNDKVDSMVDDIDEIKEFQKDMEAEVSDFKRRLDSIEDQI
uniref:Uncharacterized protein n=1 Tax=uncultured organism TaxID=155900 RepID=M1PQA4_9ZZZZ|nr:hypothetical protein FLSS-23_0005 [uncultured organism]